MYNAIIITSSGIDLYRSKVVIVIKLANQFIKITKQNTMNFISKITTSFAALAFATTAMAGSINQVLSDGSSQPDLTVTTGSMAYVTGSSATVYEGDKVAFNIAYNLNEGPAATNLRAYIENLNGQTFEAGDSEVVTGRITSSNYSSSNGSVTLNFADTVRLSLYNVSWQKQTCSSVGCETPLLGSASDVISSNGLSLGDVSNTDSYYKGGVVVEFKAFPADEDDNLTSNNDDADVTTESASSVDEDSARLNGEFEGEDNTEVWFAFDEDDSTPSCNAFSQQIGEQTVDDNEDFSKTVTGLDENETYYFRACAYDEDGDVISGSIKSFTTDEEDDEDENEDDVDVSTDSATSVDEDSARLNGEVEGDDNVEVWFAFSRIDSTPSCNASSQEVSVSGSYDDGDDFAKTVTGLSANTEYFFRACAEDNDGSVVSGSIRSFITDDGDDNTITTTSDEPRTVTNVASTIGTTSARLNSIVLGDDDAVCYFQYGRTTSFGLTSPRTAVDLDQTSNCSSFRSGLASNSTYYYRAVIEQDGNTYYGSTRTFRTNAVVTTTTPSVPTPSTPTVTPTDTTITIVNRNETVVAEELEVTKWVSAETDPLFEVETDAKGGETVYYKVRVTNNTGSDLEDVVVIDRIPFYLELDESASINDDDDKQIRWVIDLEEGESRTFITEMRVREDAREGDVIESYASAENDDFAANSNDVFINVEDGSIAVVDTEEVEANQTASIFGAGFFPTTLTGWAILLAALLAIVYFFSRVLIARNENERVLAELAAAQAARSNG